MQNAPLGDGIDQARVLAPCLLQIVVLGNDNQVAWEEGDNRVVKVSQRADECVQQHGSGHWPWPCCQRISE